MTDEQIRAAINELTKNVLHYGADVAAFQKVLLRKGLVTESEIAEAIREVKREGQEQIDKAMHASRQKPPGGIQ